MELTEIKNLLSLTLKKRQALNDVYSQNAFARDLGISPTALSQFLTGKRNLSESNLKRLIEVLELDNEDLKKLSRKVIPFPGATVINQETFSLIAEWYHLAILNLSQVDTITQPSQISARLGISLETATAAVQRLLELGFLVQTDGVYKRLQKALDTGTGFPSEAMRQHNREKMELAIKHLEHGPLSERDMSSLTMCVDRECMVEIKNEIARFKRRVASLCEPKQNSEVYALNVQLFPLSQPFAKDF